MGPKYTIVEMNSMYNTSQIFIHKRNILNITVAKTDSTGLQNNKIYSNDAFSTQTTTADFS